MTTPATTTADLQAQLNALKATVEGLQKNIAILDGNLQKIYTAYNAQVNKKPAPAPAGGGWL
jgi:prefoldin subunit 5